MIKNTGRYTLLKQISIIVLKQNRESFEGYLRWKVAERYGKFGKTGLNWVKASPKRGTETGVPKGKLFCWHATAVANAPWKPLVIRWKSARYHGHEIVDQLGSHCNWSKVRRSFIIREIDFILLKKIHVSAIINSWMAFQEVSLFEYLIEVVH